MKKIGDPLRNDFGTLSQKAGLKCISTKSVIKKQQQDQRIKYTKWIKYIHYSGARR